MERPDRLIVFRIGFLQGVAPEGPLGKVPDQSPGGCIHQDTLNDAQTPAEDHHGDHENCRNDGNDFLVSSETPERRPGPLRSGCFLNPASRVV